MNTAFLCLNCFSTPVMRPREKTSRRSRAGLLRRLALCVPGSREANRLLRELSQLTRRAARVAAKHARRVPRRD